MTAGYEHPIFGWIQTDELDADERTLNSKLEEIHQNSVRKGPNAQTAWLMEALDAIGTDKPVPLQPEKVLPRATAPSSRIYDECSTPLGPDEWQDPEGRIWDVKIKPRPVALAPVVPAPVVLAAPLINSSSIPAPVLSPEVIELSLEEMDLIRRCEDEPAARPTTRNTLSRYDRAFVEVREAEEAFSANAIRFGPADNRTTEAARLLAERQRRFEKEKVRGKLESSRRQDAVDLIRQTPEGQAKYNESRRKSRSAPNADLSVMTADEKKKHKSAQAAARMRNRRENKRIAGKAIT